MPRVTEPFFSTKISGEGLGLGLLISQAVIQEFGSQISLTTAPGAGTEVTITLPHPALQTGPALHSRPAARKGAA